MSKNTKFKLLCKAIGCMSIMWVSPMVFWQFWATPVKVIMSLCVTCANLYIAADFISMLKERK